MRIIKATLPLFILATLAIYIRHNFSLLPVPLANAMQYLPILLILFVSAITLHFNQARILSYILILSCLYFSLDYHLLDSEFKFALFTTLTPILLLVIVLLREQSIVSVKAIPLYLLFLFTLFFALWLIREQPDWAISYLLTDWLPIRYFDWTKLPQTTLIIFIVITMVLIMLLTLRQNTKTAAAIGIIIILFISLHLQSQGSDLIIFTSAGMILCLFVVLQESWRMAYLDELTQLPARRALHDKLQSLVGLYTIAMVDIDFFKKFNDKYGHKTGDEALRMVAAKLKNTTGGGVAYRYGGEEFTIVFTNKSIEQAKEHLEKTRKTIANTPFVVNRGTNNKRSQSTKKQSVSITVSIGLADSINISSTAETMKQADIALYKAKKKGRNRIET